MKHYLLICVLCCCLFSCEEDFFLENVEFTPRLVANSLFTEGSELEVFIHSTRNILDQNSQINTIADANVVLKDENGSVLATLDHQLEGRYHTNALNLEVGKSYTLEVSSEGFETITATSSIPTRVDASIMNANIISEQTSESLDVNLQLRDNDAADNYYVYEVIDEEELHFEKEQPFKLRNIQNIKVLLSSNDENQETVATNTLLQSRVFLKDRTFANAEYNINFKAKSNPAAVGPVVLSSEEIFDDKKMRVITASKTMYEYYKSIEVQRLKGDANSSITQPTAVHSNVSNGLGVFAGYNEDTLELPF